MARGFTLLILAILLTACTAPCPTPAPIPTPITLPQATPLVIQLPGQIIEKAPPECYDAIRAADAIMQNTSEWLDATTSSNWKASERLTEELGPLFENYGTLKTACFNATDDTNA